METTPKPSLKDILAQKGSPSKEPATPQDTTKSIKTVLALMAQIEGISSTMIAEALAPIGNDQNKKASQRAIQTLIALNPNFGEKEPWEVAAQAELLKTLREKIATKTIGRNRRAFESRANGDSFEMIKALTAFRIASKPEELALCSRDMIPPGPSKLGRASHAMARDGEMPVEIEEIIYTLVQFRLGAEKNTRAGITEQTAQELKEATIALQNPNKKTPVISEEIKAEAKPSAGAQEEYLKMVKAIFEKLNLDAPSLATLEKEIELFGAAAEDVGTELEALHGIQKEEFTAIRTLEGMFTTMDAAAPVKGRPNGPENLRLAIFQALRESAPALGKAATMNLTTKLAQDESWIENFIENGADAVFEARAYRNHAVLTEPENGLFGNPTGADEYLREGQSLLSALAAIDQAENILYSEPLTSALNWKNREDALYCAEHLIAGGLGSEEMKDRATLKKEVPGFSMLTDLDQMEKTRKRAEEISDAIHKEIDGRERNLALLPIALKERELRGRVDAALSRIISTTANPEIQGTVNTLLAEEKENLEKLLEDKSPDEAETRARIHCQEKIATLQTLLDVSENMMDMSEKDYETLLRVASGETVPKTLRDHALVTLCDNKSGDGTRVKTKEMLDRIENLTGAKDLTRNLRQSMGVLRRWRDREAAPQIIGKAELAKSVCSTPKEIRRLLGAELVAALQACLEASPWKDPFVIDQKETGKTNREYLLAKAAYAGEPKTFAKLKALHAATAEIIQASNGSGWVKGQKMAEAMASKEPGNLQQKEQEALQATLNAKDPAPAIAYLSAWYGTVGNQQALRREAILNEAWEPTKIPMVGARIQSRIENLIEIGGYAKAVANNPEALAEAYIQHELHESRGGEERWDLRMDRLMAKTGAEIDRTQVEFDDWFTKFNAIFDEDSDEGMTDDEVERRTSTKTVCRRKLAQKERELESLFLKSARLRELKETCESINGAESAEELVKALHTQDRDSQLNSMSSALDQAFALAKTPTKLNLPKENQPSIVSAFQIMEGASVQKTVEHTREILSQARDVLKTHRPELQDISEENPQDTARALKRAAFQTLKEVEVNLWESGKSIEMAEEELEHFIRENPEVLANRQAWVEGLQKTQGDLAATSELAASLPQRQKGKKAKKAKEDRPENRHHDLATPSQKNKPGLDLEEVPF